MKIIKKCTSSTARAPRYGKMAPNTRETGEMAWPRVKAISTMPMATYTRENSTRIEPMALEFMFTRTDRPMKVSGEMTCKTVRARRS